MTEADLSAHEHFLSALKRRREALPAAARALIDVRLDQLSKRSMPITRMSVSSVADARNESPLAALVRDLEMRTRTEMPDSEPGAVRELKSAHHFRDQLTDISITRQVEQALAEWPENAGPLNSHFLALQAIDMLRGEAPRYLRRFVEYLDTLFWLDSLDKATKDTERRPRARKKRA